MCEMINQKDEQPSKGSQVAGGLGLGLIFGVAIGAALNNLAIGIAIGILFGGAFGAGMRRPTRNKDK